MRAMVKGGFRRKGGSSARQDDVGYDWAFVLKNADILRILDASDLTEFIRTQQINWVAHVVRMPNERVGTFALTRFFFDK